MNDQAFLPQKKRGFIYREIYDSIILSDLNIGKINKLMKRHVVFNVEINANYFPGEDLSIVGELKYLKGLYIIGSKNWDLSALPNLDDLSILHIDCYHDGELKISENNILEQCVLPWKLKGAKQLLRSDTLRNLTIYDFDNEDLSMFSGFPNLTRLALINSKITSANGVESLISLKELDLTGSRKLKTIFGLKELINLRTLVLNDCKFLKDLNEIGHLKNLEILSFNNVGEIESLTPILNNKSLHTIIFAGNTKISDNNLEPLIELKLKHVLNRIVFICKKSYNVDCRDLQRN